MVTWNIAIPNYLHSNKVTLCKFSIRPMFPMFSVFPYYSEFEIRKFIGLSVMSCSFICSLPLSEFFIHLKQTDIPKILHFLYICYRIDFNRLCIDNWLYTYCISTFNVLKENKFTDSMALYKWINTFCIVFYCFLYVIQVYLLGSIN